MRISERAASFQESVIREMTRIHSLYGGVNLAQGFPDFDPPAEILEAACRALRDGYNQYAITWGTPRLREAVARHQTEYNGIPTDPVKNVTVCCGATEAMIATLIAVCNPGDEVIVFTPYYENYGPDAILSGARPVYVTLHEPEGEGPWRFDPEELRAAFRDRTRAIIVNTPHNPTGHVFTREELEFIAGLCRQHDVLAITDEIYEHILYDGRKHVSIAGLDGMQERTITISGASKTFSVTGWRLGWAVAPEDLSIGIRRVHDFLTVGAPHPLQEAAVAALSLPPSYFENLVRTYTDRRNRVADMVRATGMRPFVPEGAYYLMADIQPFGFPDDVAFTMHLIKTVGVAVVPGSSFYPAGAREGKQKIRFAFPKRLETLEDAARRLEAVRAG
ncbi:MAG: aminotransferase class I/II-fold pyridoxal phosphate-dependent enzyme [Armatimonadetes bacterium]|nr:aminotransferase class I/II-fold pyridoxal phosphate-dependent enzyme [Armatimonadota bacterium]